MPIWWKNFWKPWEPVLTFINCLLLGILVCVCLSFFPFVIFPIYFTGKQIRNVAEYEIKGAILFRKEKGNYCHSQIHFEMNSSLWPCLIYCGNNILKYLQLWFLKATILILLSGDFTMSSDWFESVKLNFIFVSCWFD